jgi:hypothetical protein
MYCIGKHGKYKERQPLRYCITLYPCIERFATENYIYYSTVDWCLRYTRNWKSQYRGTHHPVIKRYSGMKFIEIAEQYFGSFTIL